MAVADAESLPRGGDAGERSRLAVVGLFLVVVSPVAAVVAAVTLVAVMSQVRRSWRDIGVAAGALAAVAVVLLAVQVYVSGVPSFPVGWLAETALLGVPLGVAAGAGAVGLLERWAAGAAWHPAERRRRAVADVAEERYAAGLAEPEAVARCPVPVLGVFRGGDLEPWRRGDYVVPPGARFPAMGVIGESGSGKTVTVERFNWLWAGQGIRVIFADFKGSDPELPERVMAAYLDARPEARCRAWPAQPLDIWRGDPTEVTNRLLQVQSFNEPFYEQAAQAAVRLAVNAPGEPACRDSGQFLARLELGYLTKAYEHTAQAADVQALKMPQVMEGVRLRYAGFFAALGSRFDRGTSWEDSDLTVLTIPTLAQPSDAMAAARMVLADFGAFCMNRKPRDERVVFCVDEFSAVTGAAPMVIDLAERVRDASGMVVACVQNFLGLGSSDGERHRMLDALQPGGIVLHRTGDPGEVLRLAGTRHETDLSWQLDEAGRTGRGQVRMNRVMSVDPDRVRRLPTGSAFVLTHGRALKLSVIPAGFNPAAAEAARRQMQASSAAAAQMDAGQQAWLARQAAAQRRKARPAAAVAQGALDGAS